MGTAKLLDHYHKFYFYFNISELEITYRQILRNVVVLEVRDVSLFTQQNIKNLKDNCLEIENQIAKLKYSRSKRALFDGLGTAIKYISGNLDNNDLMEINKHLESLYKNQANVVKQMNKYTSFANHITNRYFNDLKTLENNINSTLTLINRIDNVLETQMLIQYNYYLSTNLLDILRRIEVTISLAFNEIVNLEIISHFELLDMIYHLQTVYKESELLKLDVMHLFKILEFSKFRVLSVADTITCILYIPVLKTPVYQYFQIYPIPSLQNEVLLPTTKYFMQGTTESLWTEEECKKLDGEIICIKKPTTSECSLESSEQCVFANVQNDYKLHAQLNNNQVIVAVKSKSEVIEECPNRIDRIKIQHCVLLTLNYNCKIIFDGQTYDNVFTNYSYNVSSNFNTSNHNYITKQLNLKLKHLENINDLISEAVELSDNINLQPIFHFIHFSITITLILFLCSVCILLIMYRKRISTFIRNKLKIKHIENPIQLSLQNEDVLS